MSSGLLSDRTLAFATTPCFRIDVSDVARLQSFPGDSVQGTLKISKKFLGSGSSNSSYHSIDVTIKAEARIRSSIHMPQGNVVPTFEKISLWKLGRVQLWPRPSTSEPDELGLVSIPFTVKVPLTVPALSNQPFGSHGSAGKRSSQQQVAQQVVQIAPLPSCTLPPGLQIVVSIVAEAHRTSALVKRPREDIVQVPILLHRKPSDKLLRWLPPAEDPSSHLLRFDPHFWTSSTTIVTLKQTLLDRRRLWITLTIPNVSRSNGAAESERIPFLLELTYQSKRSSSSTRGPPFNMVDKTALPALPLSTTKAELQPRLFVGQRVACTLEDGTTSDFRQDDLEIEWDPFHLEHIPTLAATSNTQTSSSFTPRDRVQLRLGASSSGLELFQGHGWTLPERKSINEIKAFRKSLERGGGAGAGAGADLDSVDDVVGVDDEGDEEDEGGAHESSVDSKDRSLSHHTSSAFSTLRKALLPSADPDTVGYWISRAAISGTFHAPPALPSFDYSFGAPLRKDAKESGSGFESSSSCARGHLSLGYEVGVSWTVPESVAAGPDDPRSAHGKKRTIVTFKTFERGLVPWFSSSTGSYPSTSSSEDGEQGQGQGQGQGRGGRRSDIGTGVTAFPPTRADTLRNARAKCKAAKLGRTEPNLSLAETEALDEEAENGGGKGKEGAQVVARPEKHGDDDEDDEDEDEAGGTEGQERRRRLRERNALLFNLPPGYFAATSDFEDMPKPHPGSSSAAAAVAGAGVGAGQAPVVQHNHPVKN